MAKKATKKAPRKAKTVKRAKLKRPRATARRGKPPAEPAKAASDFQAMIDTINETERMREKRGSDEPE